MTVNRDIIAEQSDRRRTRRQFLQAMSASTLAALMAGEPRQLLASSETGLAIEHPKPRADACIVLWMAGGMAGPDSFDPKRYHPFEVGTPVEKIISTFPAIDTSLDGVQISEGLENIAKIMHKATLCRSLVLPDLGDILHSRHQYHWHTGYIPPQTVAAPHIGAWMARVLGPQNPVIPPFINIGQRLEGVGESEELKAFTTAGFFGSEYGPFNLPFPEDAAQAVQPPEGMTPGRFSNRHKFYKQLVEKSPQGRFMSDYQQESMVRAFDGAYRLLNSEHKQAFDLSLEKPSVLKKYDTGRFGRGCLLARRLVEAGARFIEVTTEYVPFLHWDTHENGHVTAKRMKQEIDQPVAQLIHDLEDRGLLDRTLVILATEFSRDMIIEGIPGSTAKDQSRAKTDVIEKMVHYGLHRHFTGAVPFVMWGGGTKQGYVHGESAPERPCIVTRDPVSLTDLHATIMTLMGISPKTVFDIERRPFYVTEDGHGKPIEALFA